MDVPRLLDGLDPAQRQAVTCPDHPLAILAGAGSGKTRVLTRRIAYRCATGDADARHVMAVTFTRKAAAELDQRLRALGLRDRPSVGTFHGLAYAQLRTGWAAANTAPPVLLDRKGRVLSRILGNTKRIRPSDLATEIEWAKARLVAPEDYEETVHRVDRRPPVSADRIAGWYRSYEDTKAQRGLIDFDDLLARATAAIASDPTFAAAQRWRFRHLFVDEYQDVNPLQEGLLRAWLGDRPDLCVVGDPNQAIYGWNGADADYLDQFARHYEGATVVELRDSYRSSPQILEAAASVLARGGSRTEPLRSHRPDGPPVTVVGYQSDLDEAHGIARALRDHHQPGRSWSAQAVLLRTNGQAAIIEAALRRATIPYRVRGASRFLDNPDVLDLLKRFDRIREPLSATLSELDASVGRQRRAILGVDDADDQGDEPDRLADRELPDTAVGRRIVAFEQVIRLGFELAAQEPHSRTDALPGWLRTVLLDETTEVADAVTIATFHAAKGLEWDVVHLAGIETGYVPISHARSPDARQEEERLFYVAATRAARVLRCSWAATRTFGADPVDRTASPYLLWVRQAPATPELDLQLPDGAAASSITASRTALDRSQRTTEEIRAAIADDLRRWRRDQGRRASVRPTVVLSDRALDEIARSQPRAEADLVAIASLGPSSRTRHGARLLEVVARHCAMPASPSTTGSETG